MTLKVGGKFGALIHQNILSLMGWQNNFHVKAIIVEVELRF